MTNWRRRVATTVATVGPLGRSSIAPGTWGAAAAFPVAAALIGQAAWVWAIATAIVIGLGVWAAGVYLETSADDDPNEVVVDEFAGCLIALSCVPTTWPWWLAAFVTFRVLDVSKPWVVGWCDRHVHGAFGIMADDVVAGVWAGATMGMLARAVA